MTEPTIVASAKTTEPSSWLVFTYRVPAEPATKRVALWRRLKRMGAIYLQNGVCLLPRNDDNSRRLKMLENDVGHMGGESLILQTVALDHMQREKVIERFKADRSEAYRELLDKCASFEDDIAKECQAGHFSYHALEKGDVALKKLRSWFEKIKIFDFYATPMGTQAEEGLRQCEAHLSCYAQRVFDAHSLGG
ncbi:MAG: Chromate resistance protein ChrB [Rhizomicrobium sp.]